MAADKSQTFRKKLARARRRLFGDRRSPPLTAKAARETVIRVFAQTLRRPASEHDLTVYSKAIAFGGMDAMAVATELSSTTEFGFRALQHPPVARHVARTLIGHLTGRQADEAAVEAYAHALEHGYSLESFLAELTSGTEFKGHFQKAETPQNVDGRLLNLGQMTEQLVAAKLIGEGCVLGFPPQPGGGAAGAPSERQVADLIRTLAMLGSRTTFAQAHTQAATEIA